MNKGEYQAFNYTGGIQTFVVPNNGIYKLEVYGAQGGYAGSYTGGQGGTSVGYKKLKKGTTLYICVGGQGGYGQAGKDRGWGGAGGYNGGGSGYHDYHDVYWDTYCGGGGGATHIAKVSGTLASIGQSSFNTNGLIVAGGGGGAGVEQYGWGSKANGASGGGPTGGGNTFGQGQNGYRYGEGAAWISGGGGGGYIGGRSGREDSAPGGTGWVGNVDNYKTYSKSTTNGGRSGNGYAKITLMQKINVKIGNLDFDSVYIGSTEFSSLYNGTIEI